MTGSSIDLPGPPARPNAPPLLILGASVRAAATSAARAGFAPTGVDLFADRDLAARFPAHRVDRRDYPAGLARIAATLPDSPWIYTGAFENHPDQVDRIARERPLLGVSGDALRAVRDPARWTESLRRAGLPALDCRLAGDEPPTCGAWLLKPRASAMGLGIRRWEIGEGPIPHGLFLEAEAQGTPMAALFVGDGLSARLAGVTRQLLGRSAERLRVLYRGSLGPADMSPEAGRVVERVGHALAGAFGLRGIFGVDFLMDGTTPRPVEINPRYTASVEVLEEALGISLLAEHVRAFGVEPPPGRLAGPSGPVAKVILRARRPAVVPEGWPWSDPLDPRPTVADVPAAGTVLRPGDPVLTVLARGDDVARLKATVRLWHRRIAAWPSP